MSKEAATKHIVVQLNKMELGEHNLLIYNSTEEQKALMSAIAKERLIDKNEIVVILPFYETVTAIEQQLENVEVNVSYYKKGGSLFILDAVKQLFGSAYDFSRFLKLLDQNAVKSGKHGVFVLVHLDAFFLYGESSIDKMLEYEQKIADLQLEHTILVCAYHHIQIETLDKNVKQMLFEDHQNSLFL